MSPSSTGSSSVQSPWYLDSVALDHVTNDLSHLNCYQPYQGSEQITIGDGNSIPLQHIGKGLLPTPHHLFKLNNVLHSDSISSNLVSVQKLA